MLNSLIYHLGLVQWVKVRQQSHGIQSQPTTTTATATATTTTTTTTTTIIQSNFNSIPFIYLRADLTAQRPITKRARVEKKKHTHTNNTKTRQ
jgi:hypothetical protein